MNQEIPEISNSVAKQSLKHIFQKIKSKKYIRSAYILKDLQPIIDKLDNEDQQKVIFFLQEEFKNEEFLKEFLKNNGYAQQPNYKQLYQKLRDDYNKQVLFQQLKNLQFNIDNEIHDLIYNNEQIVCRLEDKIFDLLDLNEFRLGKRLITQMDLLKILISFFFHPIIQENNYILEQIIGSQLIPQIYEFQYYLEIKQISNKDSFNKIVQLLQHRQLQFITRQEFENKILEMKDYNIFLIINSLNEDNQNFREILVQKFCKLQNCTEQQLKVESILFHIQNIENINEEFEELYFCIIFYFWMKYLIKFDIEQGLSDLKQINIMSDDTIESKEQAMQNIISEQIKSNQDYILQHFVNTIFYFSQECSLINNFKEYQKYKQNRLVLQQKINQNSSQLSLEIWKDITQLQYCQLHTIQKFRESIKFFWITQMNSDILMIISNIFEQEQPLNLFQVAVQLEDKLKKINLDNTNLIIQNILMLIPERLINVNITQKILLIKLYLKYDTFKGPIQDLIGEMFFQINVKDNKFIQLCERFYNLDEQLYDIWLQSVEYYNIFQITPKCLRNKKTHQLYPTNQKIAIEQFSFYVPEENNQQLTQAIRNWVECMNATNTYDLFQFFLDILKRSESIYLLVKLINDEIFNRKSKSGYFNCKALFQIFYNNSNQELKYLLLKHYSQQYPVPFIYQSSVFHDIQNLENLYEINDKLYYLMKKSMNIINLSLSKNQSKIGKTELINNIFYKEQKFEIGDNCQINENTIDIMFDFEFNGTRNFMIADTHGYIPLEILIKVLPLFQFCIIQIDSEDELQENIESMKSLPILNSIQTCLLIRNSKKNKIPEQQLKELEQMKIQFYQISDLSQIGIDKQVQLNEVDIASKFLLKNICANKQQVNLSKKLYLDILIQFNKRSKENSEIIIQNNNIYQEMKKELEEVISKEEGFYDQAAFKLRHFDNQNKIFQQKIVDLQSQPNCDQGQIKKLKENIEENLMFMKYRFPTRLLELFQNILMQDHVMYLWFLEKLRQFDEKNTQKLNQNQIAKRSSKNTSQIQFNTQSQDLSQSNSIKQIENELKLKKICIEIFWRELIQFEKLGRQLSINPIDALCQTIKKGEPFELLNGDSQTIDIQFLNKLITRLQQGENQKVLVLSVLGPQSSGKSTLWNKIFGCHFWTSVGRCTRGVYMQLIKLRDKSIFSGKFDQILLLDTEGLQSPNQTDYEFDQKMSLFILAISDISLLTVKGDIHKQFHNLIEICIYQYGQLAQNTTAVKQIVWCFNQNNEVQKKGPFFEQIQQLAMRVETRNNESNSFDQEIGQKQQQIDYANIIDIDTRHIWVLGFAQVQKIWDNQKWTQSSINGTFSKNAYQNGIIMIQNYIEKFENQNEIAQLQSLSQFIQTVDATWRNIEKLPDYLEFSELLQYYQNKQMKIEYYNILNKKSGDFQFKNQIRAQIKDAALNQPSEEFFFNLEQDQINQIDMKLNTIQEQIIQELEKFKSNQKISKKIYLKQCEQLEMQLKKEKLACKLIVTEEIIYQKILYYKEQSLLNLDKIIRISYKNSQKEQLNQQQIMDQFNQQWQNIVQEFSKTLDTQFDTFQMIQYETMKGQYNEFILRSTKEFEYLNLLREKINKTEPSASIEQLELLFIQYLEELKENQFRPVLQTDQLFMNLFEKTIKQKIESFEEESNYINFSKFYICQLKMEYVKKEDFEQYLQNAILEDFKESLNQNQQNQQEQIINFFQYFFDYFRLEFDYTFKEAILQINQNNIFDLLKNYLNQIKINDKLQQQNNLINFRKQNYKSLKILELKEKYPCSQIKGILQKMHTNFYIISEQVEFEYNVQDYNEYRNYIDRIEMQSQKQKLLNLNEFSKLFTNLMEKEKGWKKLYADVYKFVYQEMILNRQEYNMQNINMVIEKLNVDLIQKKFNQSFSYFGLILNKLGERCILYFGVLIIWRFICFSQWQSVNIIINELKEKKEDQLKKAFAYLQQNKIALSKISAKELYSTIKNNFEQKFYCDKDNYVQNQINNQNFNPVLYLNNQFKDTNDKDFKINYIIDQQQQIERYVDEKLNELKVKLKQELQSKLSEEYKDLKEKIKQNAQLLQQQIQPNISIEEYFEDTQNQLDYEKVLFNIVISFLQGNNSEDYKLINFKQRYIFYQNEKVIVQIPLKNLQNTKIQLLDVFVNELIVQLDQDGDLLFNLEKFKKQDQLSKKRLELIGCTVSCQYCKRKCDLQSEHHESKHKCQYGHFLIVNLSELEQQFSCDEFLWEGPSRNFQQFLENWDFRPEQNKSEKKELKQNLIKIWKDYGEEICKELKKNYKQIMQQIDSKKIHYIIILDSSESMAKVWTDMKKGVRDLISKIKIDDQQNNSQSKISLIIFNSEAKILKKGQRAKDLEDHIKMNHLGGGTNFSTPIKKAIKIIKNDKSSERFLLLFYSDGKAVNPQLELQNILQFEEAKRKKIQLIACTQAQNQYNQVLNDMVGFFNQYTKQADLFTFASADDLIQFWSVVINFKLNL